MKTITIISGKGGTGKTILAASLGAVLDHSILIDADVNAPNLSLFIKNKPEKEFEIKTGNSFAVIDNTCVLCGICVEICRFNAITRKTKSEKPEIDPNLCIGCAVCSYKCPAESIFLTERPGSRVILGKTDQGYILYPDSDLNEGVSGKLISELRNIAENSVWSKECNYIVIDGSPGTGCHVIAALTDSDIPIIVTEPTKAAKGDLIRIADLLEHFKLKGFVVINKADLNRKITDEIKEYSKQKCLEVLGNIPMFEGFFEIINSGNLPINTGSNEVRESFSEVVRRIQEKLKKEEE